MNTKEKEVKLKKYKGKEKTKTECRYKEKKKKGRQKRVAWWVLFTGEQLPHTEILLPILTHNQETILLT